MSRQLVEITGFPELIDKLKALGDDKKKKAPMLRVLRKAAQTTLKAARQNVPKSKRPHFVGGKNRQRKLIQPGNLKKSLGVINARRSKNPMVVVGPRAKGNQDGWYGHIVEYGHIIYRKGFKRKHSRSARARAHNLAGAIRHTNPREYMKLTLRQTQGGVYAEAEARLAQLIQKEIDKLST